MDENQLDDILYQACKENREILLPFGPDFDTIEKEALLKLKKRRGKHTRKVWFRTVAAVAAAFLFINGFLIFAEIEPVKAYRAQVRTLFFNIFSNNETGDFEAEIVRTSNEIAKAQKTVPYHIPVPGWLPDGYKFDNVRVSNDGNDVSHVTIQYTHQTEQLQIDIQNDSTISSTTPKENESEFEVLKVNNLDIYITSINRDNGNRIHCYYYNDQGLNVHISGNIDKQTLVKFIQELK